MKVSNSISWSSEGWRKIIHLASLIIPIGVYYLGGKLVLSFVIPITLLALLSDWLRYKNECFSNWIERFFGWMMRASEKEKLHGFVLNGATWVLLGAILTFSIFPTTIAIPAFSILILGDAFAALVGRRIGKISLGKEGKTLEGSIAFVIACLPLIFFYTQIPKVIVILGILFGAIIELLPIPINDNLRIPLLVSTFLSILLYFAR